jgi:hypothetical protein
MFSIVGGGFGCSVGFDATVGGAHVGYGGVRIDLRCGVSWRAALVWAGDGCRER